MKFNERIAAIAAGLATAVYVILPNIDEGRVEQILTWMALYIIMALMCGWTAAELVGIQRKRESLSLTAKRIDLTSRHGKVVDIRVKRRNRAVIIPAYRVVD